MSIGTDATVGYCRFGETPDVRFSKLDTLLSRARKPPTPEQKLGIVLCAYERYEVYEFNRDTKYGVHIIEPDADIKCHVDDLGWDFDWYPKIKYNDK